MRGLRRRKAALNASEQAHYQVKLESWMKLTRVVGERCVNRRSRTERSGGGDTSENAGMSSEKAGENPARRKPKVS